MPNSRYSSWRSMSALPVCSRWRFSSHARCSARMLAGPDTSVGFQPPVRRQQRRQVGVHSRLSSPRSRQLPHRPTESKVTAQPRWLCLEERNDEMTYHIKPGPKPKKEDGTDDRRRHVDKQNAPKHPTLPIHKHDPKKK